MYYVPIICRCAIVKYYIIINMKVIMSYIAALNIVKNKS